MSKTNGIDIFLGSAPIGDKSDPTSRYTTPEAAKEYLSTFGERGYRTVDTARLYPTAAPGTTEQILGQVDVQKDFVVDTKVQSFFPGAHKADSVGESVDESLEALKMTKVNVMYLHSPDRETPLEETCGAIDKAYKEGKFNHFGLSNYTADEVEKILDICGKNGWVKPAVYQGQYNTVMRNAEQLLPVLRKHGIRFVAFSPAAGGFLSGLEFARPGSRFAPGTPMSTLYNSVYGKDELKELADTLVAKAHAEGMTGHAVALRWIIHHSQLQQGDAVIIAASNLKQLKDNIDALEAGPLSTTLLETLDELWGKAKGSAVPYHN